MNLAMEGPRSAGPRAIERLSKLCAKSSRVGWGVKHQEGKLCAPERTTGNRSQLRALSLMLGCWLRFQRLDYETCVNGTTYRTFVPNASQSHSASTVCCDVCAAVRGLARPRPLATDVGNREHPAHHCRASVAVWTSHCEA